MKGALLFLDLIFITVVHVSGQPGHVDQHLEKLDLEALNRNYQIPIRIGHWEDRFPSKYNDKDYYLVWIMNHNSTLDNLIYQRKSAKKQGVLVDYNQLSFDEKGKLTSIAVTVSIKGIENQPMVTHRENLTDSTCFGVVARFSNLILDSCGVGMVPHRLKF